jgi:hypothetical protein
MLEGSEPAISIITPTFNRAHSLKAAIDSVRQQSMGDYEHIVVDDGSSDGTKELVLSYSDPRLRYHRQEPRQGANPARNLGLMRAKAPLVTFLDSDDRFQPHRLACSLELFQNEPQLTLQLSSFALEEEGAGRAVPLINRNARLDADGLELLLLWHACYLAGSAITVRRQALVAAGGFAAGLGRLQDRELLLQLLRHQGAAWRRGNGPRHWAACTERIDWIKVTSSDSISAPDGGFLTALGAVLGCHPELRQRHRLALRFLVAQVLANRLGRRDPAAALRAYRENRSTTTLGFGPLALLRGWLQGGPHYDRLFEASTGVRRGPTSRPPI